MLVVILAVLWLGATSAVFVALWFCAAAADLATNHSANLFESLLEFGLMMATSLLPPLVVVMLVAIEGLFGESGPIGEILSTFLQLFLFAAAVFIAFMVMGYLGGINAVWSSWLWMLGGVALALVGGLLGYFVLSTLLDQ